MSFFFKGEKQFPLNCFLYFYFFSKKNIKKEKKIRKKVKKPYKFFTWKWSSIYPPYRKSSPYENPGKKKFRAFKYRGSKNSVHCFCSMKSLRKQKQWRDKNRPYKFKLDFRQISGSTKNWRKRGQGGFCSTIWR